MSPLPFVSLERDPQPRRRRAVTEHLRAHLDELKASMNWAVCMNVPFSVAEIKRLEGTVEAALDILNEAPLISDYAGGDATEKSHWRYVPDPVPGSTIATRETHT